jgi:hypothetical protein
MTKFNSAHGAMKAILESAHNKAEILPMRRSTRPKTHAK